MSRVAEWVRPLGEGAQKRHWHETVRGRVIRFSVQLEVWFSDGWQPILRYDAAHGFAHRDVYETPSRKHKERIDLTMPEALTVADRDIDRNWQGYAEAFSRRNKE